MTGTDNRELGDGGSLQPVFEGSDRPFFAFGARGSGRRRAVSALRDYGIVVAFVALFITLSIASPVFLTKQNILNILDQQSGIGVMACAATLVLIAGGLDLSVGAVFAASGVIAAEAAGSFGVAGALLAGALAGGVLGLINGGLTTIARINSFIATLATQIVIRGVAVAATGGLLITVTLPSFSDLGTGQLLGVKYTIWIWAAFAAICAIVLTRTVLGRYIYASGGNAEAARLSGVPVGWVRTATFVLSGLAAGIAGVMATSQISTGQGDAATGIELQVIAAAVVGGTSILGGEGAIWRALVGVLLIAMINNGLNLLNINPTYQQMVQGVIILIAVGIDAWTRRTQA